MGTVSTSRPSSLHARGRLGGRLFRRRGRNRRLRDGQDHRRGAPPSIQRSGKKSGWSFSVSFSQPSTLVKSALNRPEDIPRRPRRSNEILAHLSRLVRPGDHKVAGVVAPARVVDLVAVRRRARLLMLHLPRAAVRRVQVQVPVRAVEDPGKVAVIRRHRGPAPLAEDFHVAVGQRSRSRPAGAGTGRWRACRPRKAESCPT